MWLSTLRQVYRNALALLGIAAPERMDRRAESDPSDDETTEAQ